MSRKYDAQIMITCTKEQKNLIKQVALATNREVSDIGRELLINWANEHRNEAADRLMNMFKTDTDTNPVEEIAPETAAVPNNAILVRYKSKATGHRKWVTEYIQPIEDMNADLFQETEKIILELANKGGNGTAVETIRERMQYRLKKEPDISGIITVLLKSKRINYDKTDNSFTIRTEA